jgi:hypothetical protein
VCPIPLSPFLFGCRYFADVPSGYDVAKGPTSFGAAHLRFCSAWFVTLLAASFVSSYDEAFVYIHLNFFAADDNGLK